MISIRNATVNDSKSIAKLNANEFGYQYPLDKTAEKIKHILSKDTDRIFVICDDKNVVGYVHACSYEGTYFEFQKNIMAIAVDSAQQGRGLGKALLIAVEKWAKAENCAGVRLVSGMNRQNAHEFYQHCGYTLRKEQKNFIKLF